MTDHDDRMQTRRREAAIAQFELEARIMLDDVQHFTMPALPHAPRHPLIAAGAVALALVAWALPWRGPAA
ncbi:hypothetical protein [Jannaschia sp. LMIT008]|uniref:hypothetical protein n=1 Tax=Jannaschia maritima TaxID=3032585 RepID=UPI00281251D4|nr:hypothetical protein [Jannaschia sp. LMIT008]